MGLVLAGAVVAITMIVVVGTMPLWVPVVNDLEEGSGPLIWGALWVLELFVFVAVVFGMSSLGML